MLKSCYNMLLTGNEAMAGLCGSDNRAACDNPKYCPERGSWHHAALCCTYVQVGVE